MCLAYYIFPIFDVAIGIMTNYYNLLLNKIQVKINELNIPQDNTSCMGFQYEPSEEIYDEE